MIKCAIEIKIMRKCKKRKIFFENSMNSLKFLLRNFQTFFLRTHQTLSHLHILHRVKKPEFEIRLI